MSTHLLSIVLFTPLVGALIVVLLPASRPHWIRLWANIAALCGFLVSLPLVFRFDKTAESFQFVEKASWIPSLGVQYYLGLDGISLLLVMLTTVIGAVPVTFVTVPPPPPPTGRLTHVDPFQPSASPEFIAGMALP